MYKINIMALQFCTLFSVAEGMDLFNNLINNVSNIVNAENPAQGVQRSFSTLGDLGNNFGDLIGVRAFNSIGDACHLGGNLTKDIDGIINAENPSQGVEKSFHALGDLGSGLGNITGVSALNSIGKTCNLGGKLTKDIDGIVNAENVSKGIEQSFHAVGDVGTGLGNITGVSALNTIGKTCNLGGTITNNVDGIINAENAGQGVERSCKTVCNLGQGINDIISGRSSTNNGSRRHHHNTQRVDTSNSRPQMKARHQTEFLSRHSKPDSSNLPKPHHSKHHHAKESRHHHSNAKESKHHHSNAKESKHHHSNAKESKHHHSRHHHSSSHHATVTKPHSHTKDSSNKHHFNKQNSTKPPSDKDHSKKHGSGRKHRGKK